jgi:hypothetical protein
MLAIDTLLLLLLLLLLCRSYIMAEVHNHRKLQHPLFCQ